MIGFVSMVNNYFLQKCRGIINLSSAEAARQTDPRHRIKRGNSCVGINRGNCCIQIGIGNRRQSNWHQQSAPSTSREESVGNFIGIGIIIGTVCIGRHRHLMHRQRHILHQQRHLKASSHSGRCIIWAPAEALSGHRQMLYLGTGKGIGIGRGILWQMHSMATASADISRGIGRHSHRLHWTRLQHQHRQRHRIIRIG